MNRYQLVLFCFSLALSGLCSCQTNERATTGIANERGIITGNTTEHNESQWRRFLDPTGKTVDLMPD